MAGIFGPQAEQIQKTEQAQPAPQDQTPVAQFGSTNGNGPIAKEIQAEPKKASFRDFEIQGAALEAMTGIRQRG